MRCTNCEGTGLVEEEVGTKVNCPDCEGKGEISMVVACANVEVSIDETSNEIGRNIRIYNDGELILTIEDVENFELKIPPSIELGQQMPNSNSFEFDLTKGLNGGELYMKLQRLPADVPVVMADGKPVKTVKLVDGKVIISDE